MMTMSLLTQSKVRSPSLSLAESQRPFSSSSSSPSTPPTVPLQTPPQPAPSQTPPSISATTTATTTTHNSQRESRHLRWTRVSTGALLAVTASIIAVSFESRKYRKQRIQELPLAGPSSAVWNAHYANRSLADVAEVVRRTGLMGSSRSVKTELDSIRKWHHDHGYKGGLVLRDLSKPLFGTHNMELWENNSSTEQETGHHDHDPQAQDLTIGEILDDTTILARRECYYLYYELKGNGAIKQEIFCRGTTLFADILTSLQAYMVYDEDLECRVHKGFCRQADRILEDVLPLLHSPTDRRATIELAGHSLGGAVAVILAIKLRKRGYRVIRVTTVGEPRFCARDADGDRILELLPKDHLRVENDQDFVPFLPPFGSHIGNKLWLINNRSARFVPYSQKHEWTDSVWFNFRIWEVLSVNGRPHRVPYYVSQIENQIEEEPV